VKNFKWSVLISTVLVTLGGYWGFSQGGLTGAVSAMYIVLVLAAIEVSLSFDNAVVNAGVLKDMNTFWRKMFLTVGIFVAVFGMRLVFPVAIVSVSANMGMLEVARLALDNPTEYSKQLSAHSAEVSMFGGIFLLMVFLSYFFDSEKDVHWVHWLESRMSKYGDVHYLIATIAMATVFLIYAVAPAEVATKVFIAGMSGIMTYVMVDVVGDYLGGDGEAVARSGAGAFLYLEVLDASFSFDGVIGAFAITNDIVIIMLGLGIGAFFVRSITIYLVEKGTLTEYRFLEHGAHYAIGALALIMLLSLKVHIPEVVTGLIGIALIALSVYASKKRMAVEGTDESIEGGQSTDHALPYSDFVVTRCSLTGSSAETVSSWKLTGLVAAVARDENAAVIEVTWIDGAHETVNMTELRSAMLAGHEVQRIKIAAEMHLVAYQKAYYDNEREDKTKPRYKLWHVGNDGKAQNVSEPLLAVEIADYVQMLSCTWYSTMAYVEYADTATFVDRQALEVSHLEGMESLTVERMNMDFRVLKVTPI